MGMLDRRHWPVFFSQCLPILPGGVLKLVEKGRGRICGGDLFCQGPVLEFKDFVPVLLAVFEKLFLKWSVPEFAQLGELLELGNHATLLDGHEWHVPARQNLRMWFRLSVHGDFLLE